MDFILNSKTKKVEIFYENAAEQQAILSFMSQYLTYKEDKTTPNIYINDPGISWTAANAPYTITTTDNLTGTISLGNYSDSAISAAKLESNISDSTITAAKLNNTSDESGYSCLTAYIPNKAKAK